jgi:hypothetical protein
MNIERSASGTFYIYSSYKGATTGDNFDGLTTGDATKKRFLAAYDAQGAIKWVRGVSNEREQRAWMTYSPAGYLFFGSTIYVGTILFGSSSVVVPAPNGNSRAAICQYDTSGNFVQVSSIGKTDTYTSLLDLEADSDGTLYALIGTDATGDYNGLNIPVNTDFPGSILLAKFSASGVFESVKMIARTADLFAYYSMSFAPNHDIYIGGHVVSYTIQFNGVTIPQGAGVMTRWTPDGNNVWVKPMVTGGSCKIQNIEACPDGSIAFAGYYTGTIQGGGSNDSGVNDALVGKMDENGNVLWSRNGDDGANTSPIVYGLAVDQDGNVYFNGVCQGGLTFNGINGICSSDGPYDDAFIAKYYADGTYAWGSCEGGGSGVDLIVQPDNTVLSAGTTLYGNNFSPVVTYLNRWRNPRIVFSSLQSKYCQEETAVLNWTATDGAVFQGLTPIYLEVKSGDITLYNFFQQYINGGSSGTINFKFQYDYFSSAPYDNVTINLIVGSLSSGRSTSFPLKATPIPYFLPEERKACYGNSHWMKPDVKNIQPDIVSWTPASNLQHADSIAALLVSVQDTQRYFVTFTNTTDQCSATDSLLITPYQFYANIYGPSNIYEPIYQNYIAQNYGHQPVYPLSYKWLKNGVMTSQNNPYQVYINDTTILHLTITDNTGCVRTDQQTVTYYPPRYLRGTVVNHDSTNVLPFVQVQVWKIQNQQLNPIPQVAITNTNGRYFFKVTGIDSLLVRAIPDTLLYPTEAPTWYKRKYFIQNANRVWLMGDTTTLSPIRLHDIAMLPDSNGILGGTIQTLFADFSSNAGPVSGLTLWIADATGQPLRYDITDANGGFYFDHLPLGEYKFMVDRWGIKNQLAPKVTLSAQKRERSDLEGVLLNDRLIFNNAVGTEDPENNLGALTIMPNPTDGWFSVFLPEAQGWIDILDATGRIIYRREVANVQSEIDLSAYPAGIYQIRWDSGHHILKTGRIFKW